MATQIRVKTQDDGRVVYLELSEDQPINANFQFKDIQDFKSNKGSHTFNFRIPSTTNNDIFFEQYFEVGSYGNYNPNKKVDAIIIKDSVEVFEGSLQLTNVITSKGKSNSYECIVFSSLSSIGQLLEGKYLSQHDWSDYEYTLTTTNVEDSFTQDLLNGDIVHSLYDYGANLFVTYGSTYSIENLNVLNLKPQIRLNKVFSKILEEIGYTYESTFLDTTMDDLYMDLNSGSSSIRTNLNGNYYMVSAFADGTQTITDNAGAIATIVLDDTTNVNYSNGSGNWDNTTNIYSPDDLWNQQQFFLNITLEVTNAYVTFELALYNITDDEIVVQAENNGQPILFINGLGTTTTQTFQVSSGSSYALDSTKTYKWILTTISGTGTSISVTDAHGVFTPLSYVIPSQQGGGLTGVPFDATLVFNPALNFPNVKAVDFISSLAKKFNLIIVPDKLEPTHLYIEPYSEWIGDGNEVDWTEKLDISKDIQLQPTSDLQAKSLLFTDADGQDLFNKSFKELNSRTYGSLFVDNTENDFGKDTDEIKTIFTPVISSYIPSSGGGFSEIDSCICYAEDETPEAIRLSFYAGTKTITNPINLTDGFATTPDSVTYTIPVLSNYKDSEILTTTECLTFAGENNTIQDAPTSLNGAFQKYWKQFIDETYSRDARIMKATFYLDAIDIMNLNFNDIVSVKNEVFRINKISNFPLTGKASCKVELIKVEKVNILDDNGDECNSEPAIYGVNGFVLFVNTDTGVFELPSPDCCEAYGYVYQNGACYQQSTSPNDPSEPLPNADFTNTDTGGQNTASGMFNNITGNENAVGSFSSVIGLNNNNKISTSYIQTKGDANVVKKFVRNATIDGDKNVLHPYRTRHSSTRYKINGTQYFKNIEISGDYGMPFASGESLISGGADPLYNVVGRSGSGHFVKQVFTTDEESVNIGQQGEFTFDTTTPSTYQSSATNNCFRLEFPSMIYFEIIVAGHNRGTTQNRSQAYSMRKYSGVINNTNNSGNIRINDFTKDVTKESGEFTPYVFTIRPHNSVFDTNEYYNDGMMYFGINTSGAVKLDNVDWTIDFRYSSVGLQNISRSATGLVFSPTSISGCLLWVDASDDSTITHSSGSVSQWDDKSGNNHHMTQSTATYRPTYVDDVTGAYIEFDGTDNVLGNQTSALINVSDSANTIFVVYQSDVTTTSSGGDCVAGVSFRGRQYHGININSSHAGAGATSMMNRSAQNFDPFLNNISATTKQVVYGTRSGITRKIYDQDGNSATHTNSSNTSQDNFCIGSAWEVGRTPLANFDGKVYEVIVYNSLLNDAELEQVHNYLQTKWNT